ncbi:mitochondrial import inner membrane translocase subunit Tim10 B [Gadus macrocephalus]|uniref:mitochondrial import inner membrane translocase subunit Tim10 B n=1 Tax=Gadus macrocephalus TaxID=80720 RepID=UPI0028CB332A|nr:mitochondrial import inner membrane translocase subunit Tim10 B [Gadus macrocephalus]
MEPEMQIRNLRDFLLVYNRMTETCFQRCSSNFNYRNLTMVEDRCVDNCAGKLIRANNRLMGTYVQLMPKMVQKRMDEMQSKVAEAEAAAAAAAAAAAGSVTEAPNTTEFSIDQTSPLPPPAYPSPVDTDTGPLHVLTGPVLDSGPTSLVEATQSHMALPVPIIPAPAEAFIPTPFDNVGIKPASTFIPPSFDNVGVGPVSTVVSPLPGPSVSSIHDTPLPVAHITPPVVPAPSVPTPARPESLAADVSTISKA